MGSRTQNQNANYLDLLVGELMNTGGSESPVDLCLSGNRKQIAAIPLRYRLIALGFIQRLSLQELNKKLLTNGCEELYARSLWEATLIYAFTNSLPYSSWKKLLSECSSVKQKILKNTDFLASSSVSLHDIMAYVNSNSIQDQMISRTQHRTQMMKDELSNLDADLKSFNLFILSNVSSFSRVREKTRYYFCKYLQYFLLDRMNAYVKILETGGNINEAWKNLSVFRVRTVLDRKKHTGNEAKEKILNSPLSFGEIYEAFDTFYFKYIDLDWLQILLDYYGNLEHLTRAQKKQLADEVRRREKKLSKLSDDEVIEWLSEEIERKERELDTIYSKDNNKKVYQRGRTGENFLRKVLHGDIDLDRMTFLSFLVFFGQNVGKSIPADHQITQQRLNNVLSECGFPLLNPEHAEDLFFIDFLKTDDPMMFLMEEAETMAFSESNFHLYKTYLASASVEKKWEEILG